MRQFVLVLFMSFATSPVFGADFQQLKDDLRSCREDSNVCLGIAILGGLKILNGTISSNNGVNLCRCREHHHSDVDFDYFLEKYNPASGSYREIASFTASDTDMGREDREKCLNARNQPECHFPD